MTGPLPRVLVVEDDSDFAVLLRRAFRKAGVRATLDFAVDGEEAIAFLDRAVAAPPALVLLDLKLPKLSGFEVLRWIKAHPKLGAVPVVVLTSSGQDRDREEVKSLGAADYQVKPAGFDELVSLLTQLVERGGGGRHP
jgi:DNA-binding response OmpR family regulator